MIRRPDNLRFDEKKHAYYLGDEKLLGVSTIAKVGEDEVWGIASAWGFRIGYEGAHDLFAEEAYWETENWSKDDLREKLKEARKTPWVKRDDAAERGTHIHDALEHLAQKGEPPIIEQYPENERPYIQALCQWYLDYRPEFVSTEVQVVSEQYKYAGRYDIRCKIQELILNDPEARAVNGLECLCLVDLKTSKSVYPTSHFPQLAGYELASVEMGFPKTDAQFVLNCKPDGTYDFVRSYATAEHFLSYLQAYRTIQELKKKGKAWA